MSSASTLAGFFRHYIEFDISAEIEPTDWLTFGEQKLRTITAGEVFHDDLGLEAIRTRFAYYPRDVWLYMLASGWQRIGQEEHLMWRAGYVGDEIGSTIIAGRLVRDLMRLCFLMERQYAPYPKWFGTAFYAVGRRARACAAAPGRHCASRRGRNAASGWRPPTSMWRGSITPSASPSRCQPPARPFGAAPSRSSGAADSQMPSLRRSRPAVRSIAKPRPDRRG